MAERVYIKSHEFDRVLNYYWAEQDISNDIFSALDQQREAGLAAGKLAAELERLVEARTCTEDRTRSLEMLAEALEDAGGMGQILEKHKAAFVALSELGKELENQKTAIDAIGGMDRLLQQHKMFMEAAREFSPVFTIEPGKRFGKPCIRGIRMTITDVLEYLTSGMTDEEVLDDFPDLTQADLNVCRDFGTYIEQRFKSLESG